MVLSRACRVLILLVMAFCLGGAQSASRSGSTCPVALEATGGEDKNKTLPSCCTPTGRAAFLTSKQPAP
jgi:hypothetical protein